jgi:hypothetical protein
MPKQVKFGCLCLHPGTRSYQCKVVGTRDTVKLLGKVLTVLEHSASQKTYKQVEITTLNLNMKLAQANQTILKAAKAQKLACSGRLLTDIIA